MSPTARTDGSCRDQAGNTPDSKEDGRKDESSAKPVSSLQLRRLQDRPTPLGLGGGGPEIVAGETRVLASIVWWKARPETVMRHHDESPPVPRTCSQVTGNAVRHSI